MPSPPLTVVVLGTGGTIAGAAARPQDHLGYTAGALTPQALLAAVPALAAEALEAEPVAQIDSCDMDHATWVLLARAVQRHLGRPEVTGIVITHGTDTLEETAVFLHHTVAATKPVVLTAAMRPATAPSPDGPQNLVDAVAVARESGARGVVAVLGGRVYAGAELRKVHGYRVDAFSGGDAGPLALVEDGHVRRFRAWPAVAAAHAGALDVPPERWPLVEILTSHAGASGALLRAAVEAGARGIVIAGTGNGTVHTSLLQAAREAQTRGVRVRRASRCVLGGVVGEPADGLPSAGGLTPAQARVVVMLELLGAPITPP
jgi:L-asparaginase